MGWKPRSLCTQQARGYDRESDIQFFADKPDAWIATESGAFVIFFPEDAHAPEPPSGELVKAVYKIAV